MPQRRKLVEFFAPHPDVAADAAKALRVSRYFGDAETPPQVRVSIWNVDVAEAAVSLTPAEAERMARFLRPFPRPRRPLSERVRESLRH